MANSEKEALYYFIVIGWQDGQAIQDDNLCGVENFFYSFCIFFCLIFKGI
ncbi:hypothetical protein [Clostridium sporogenes]|nr:hypothetical protein [Clostridium sporogenes]MCW6079689.1 hypothetical protein [Clostridium sporogenes]MDU1422636.1 hypothetical protein [Clostridium botulinum]